MSSIMVGSVKFKLSLSCISTGCCVALDGHAQRDAPSAPACEWLTGKEDRRLLGPKELTVCPLVTKIYREPNHDAQY